MHRLSVYLCVISVLPIIKVLCQECQEETSISSNDFVSSITVDGSSLNSDNINNLFEFNNIATSYCPSDSIFPLPPTPVLPPTFPPPPTNIPRPFNMTMSFSSPVLLTMIGIHGDQSNGFVNNFSLSYSEDGTNFNEYTRDTGSVVFTVASYERNHFILCSPITVSSMKITINDWYAQPCMGLLMLGCNYSNVMDHSADNANGTVNDTDCGRVDMTVVLTTIATTTETVTTTESVTQTTTESFTFNHTVTANLYCTPSPSTLQSSGTAGSASCSSRDTDNAPIYVAVAIVIAGLLITITIVIVGVILCRRYQKEKECNRSNGLLTIKDKTAMSVIEVENDLYGEERLQPQSQLGPVNPENTERTQTLYDNADAIRKKQQTPTLETADNPQYGDTLKDSNVTSDPKSNETFYSYAIP